MTEPKATIPILPSVAPLAKRYDAWICDIWGVMHNGLTAFEDASRAGQKFRAQGGTIVLVSNAPRPAPSVAAQLAGLGVAADAYDAIVTSGDVTRRLLQDAKGKAVFHLGPSRDAPTFDGISVNFADQERAELVVNTGLFDDARETPADYEAMLAQFRRRNVPMICANPDLMVERGDKLVYCAGALAELYEKLGGEVIYAGKPHLPVYDIAMEMIAGIRGKPTERSRVLAIGDGLRTDMAGAEAAGLDALFIPSLLHVPDETAATAAGIAALFADRQFRPIGAQFGLRW